MAGPRKAPSNFDDRVICGFPRTALAWCLPGFALSYALFFLRPIFGRGVMQFPKYLDAIDPIGWDLVKMLGYTRHWLQGGQSPYIGDNLYPPLTMVLFFPLTTVDFETAYRVIMGLTLLSFLICSLLIPVLLSSKKSVSAMVAMLFVGGSLSYGLQFELERGQFNLIAMASALVAVYLFHDWRRLRLLSYLLFVLAVQMKIYPLVLLPLFVDDWASWKSQTVRLLGLGVASLACTLALGPMILLEFISAVGRQMAQPQVWVGNHSIAAFAQQALPSSPQIPEAVAMFVYVACLGYSLARCLGGKTRGVDSLLTLVCVTGALLLPAISHDYTLPLMAGPIAIFLDRVDVLGKSRMATLARGALVAVAAFAYSSILFPYTNRASLPWLGPRISPLMTQSAFPAIVVILVCATLLAAISSDTVSWVLDREDPNAR